jgi:hypothetical protein
VVDAGLLQAGAQFARGQVIALVTTWENSRRIERLHNKPERPRRHDRAGITK